MGLDRRIFLCNLQSYVGRGTDQVVGLQGGLRWIRAWAACDPEFLLILDRRFLCRMMCVLQSSAECCVSMAAACLCRTCVMMHVSQNALHSMDLWKRAECLERRTYLRFNRRQWISTRTPYWGILLKFWCRWFRVHDLRIRISSRSRRKMRVIVDFQVLGFDGWVQKGETDEH